MSKLVSIVVLLFIVGSANAQSVKKPTLGQEPIQRIGRQSPPEEDGRIALALEAKEVVPFIDWGSWNYEGIHGTIMNGVIVKVHPWDNSCRGYQSVRNGRPSAIYLMCRSYCYIGNRTPVRGHSLTIFDIRLDCLYFKMMEKTYGKKEL